MKTTSARVDATKSPLLLPVTVKRPSNWISSCPILHRVQSLARHPPSLFYHSLSAVCPRANINFHRFGPSRDRIGTKERLNELALHQPKWQPLHRRYITVHVIMHLSDDFSRRCTIDGRQLRSNVRGGNRNHLWRRRGNDTRGFARRND